MENLSLLNSLNEIEHEKGDEKTVLFVEYRNSPDKLLIEIEELSNWIVERNACQWCTLDGCIELDSENIEDFLRIVLAENISRPLSELYKNENNRKTIEYFIQIVIETIKENVSPKHDFLRHFNHYGVKFLRKVSQRFNVAKNEIECLIGNSENKPHLDSEQNLNDLPDIELKTQKEQIRLLYDLGIIDFLQDKFKATLKRNENQTADLLAKILKLKKTSIQPTLNALLSNNVNRNYPKETPRTRSIIDKLNANELK